MAGCWLISLRTPAGPILLVRPAIGQRVRGLQEPSLTSTATPGLTATPSATTSATPLGASADRRLSGGAKAVIGIGAALRTLLLLGLVFFLGFRFRGARTKRGSHQDMVPVLGPTKTDSPSQSETYSYMASKETISIRQRAEVFDVGVRPDLYLYQQCQDTGLLTNADPCLRSWRMT
ncbi:hypothetical protein MCOR08_000959 [Pyricularia oryzae]|nr:hypothetical protein MCOR24_001481 [Pyricularia oryzae]KAI6587779.1 hypothetical protein MCOR06_006223 [Pyricularia oryzae]KAI6641851.1 hypothetical protein MCOR08_000959 [Pyricularia oryzae]